MLCGKGVGETYNLVFRHRGEAGVLSASLAALRGDVLNLLLGAVGEVARVLVVGHCGYSICWVDLLWDNDTDDVVMEGIETFGTVLCRPCYAFLYCP